VVVDVVNAGMDGAVETVDVDKGLVREVLTISSPLAWIRASNRARLQALPGASTRSSAPRRAGTNSASAGHSPRAPRRRSRFWYSTGAAR
jgi:hypothetical protein